MGSSELAGGAPHSKPAPGYDIPVGEPLVTENRRYVNFLATGAEYRVKHGF